MTELSEKVILTQANIENYLLNNSFSFAIKGVKNIEEVVRHTGSSFIFKVDAEINGQWQNIVVKQSREFLKIDPSFKLSPKRLLWECRAIDYVSSVIGKKFLPEVLWYDAKNFIMVLSDVQGNEGKLAKEELDRGNVHGEIMKDFAHVLANWHLYSYGKNINFAIQEEKEFSKEWKNFLLHDVVNDFYTAGARKASISSIVEDLLAESQQSKKAVIWMDSFAKNILVDEHGFRLVDFETVVNWDIAWDPAIFISDWVITCVSDDKKLAKNSKKAIAIFLTGYLKAINSKVKGKEFRDLKRRIYRYVGVFLLHRTNGADPYQFKKDRYYRV